MSLEIVSFVFGGLLILIGLLGGGFEVRELKVPQVRLPARLISTLAGVVFVILGIGLKGDSGAVQADGPTLPPPPAAMVHFTIRDEVGETQVSEQVKITLDERIVGTITVDPIHRVSEISVSVPHEGPYTYHLSVNAVFLSGEQQVEYSGVGSGTINVKAGKVYNLAGQISGNTWQAWLEEVP